MNLNQSKDTFSANARWIWRGAAAREGWWMARKTCSVPSGCHSAVLRITAGFHYIAYINGRLAARGPGRSYHFIKSYDEVDVFPFLSPGDRAVVAVLVPPGQPCGLLAELVLVDDEGNTTWVASDASWKVCPHLSFNPDTPGYAIPLGHEEQFDARLEATGWTGVDFDDTTWEQAAKLGPVGIKPWTSMQRSEIGMLSEDPILPKSYASVELARLRPGYRFRLFSPSECMKIFATEVTCTNETDLRLFFKSGEPKIYVDGLPMAARQMGHLSAGVHLLACCQLGYGAVELELLIETVAELSFSASALLKGQAAEWAVSAFPAQVVSYPWHETAANLIESTPDINRLLTAPTADRIPDDLRSNFTAAEKKGTSAYLDVITQEFYQAPGGYTLPAIENSQPRLRLAAPFQAAIQKSNNLLHSHADAAILQPINGYDTHFILDFGREYIGYVLFMLDAPAGTILDVQGFELIDGRGIAWMENHNGLRYTCREGLQTFTSHYRRGFRYVSVTVRDFNRPVKFYNLRCLHTAYPIQETGSFECSDWLLNKIYRMSIDTAALCMLDTYVDCPGHEQNFWVGDARITARINLLTFGANDLNQRSIRLVGQSLSEAWVKEYWPGDERYTHQRYLPIAAFPNYPEGGLPMWSFLWIIQCWEHYLYGGNIEDLKENYAYVTETLRRCQRLTNQRGLLDIPGAWNLIEWGNNDLSPYGEVTANNVLLVYCLEKTAEMAQALGFEKESQEYLAEARQRKETINLLCWDEQHNAYVDTVRDGWAYQRYIEFCEIKNWNPIPYPQYLAASRISVQTNTLALISNCVPPDREARVWQIAQRPISGFYQSGAPFARTYGAPTDQEAPNGIVAVGSPFFLFFTLEGFFRQKDGAGALEIMLRDWGKMAQRGTQTCWETFEYNEKNWTRSVAHAWSAAPAVYLPERILGIRPVEPGYRKFVVDPVPSALRWARGSIATPYGPIFVEWKIDPDGEMVLSVLAPDECHLNSTVPFRDCTI